MVSSESYIERLKDVLASAMGVLCVDGGKLLRGRFECFAELKRKTEVGHCLQLLKHTPDSRHEYHPKEPKFHLWENDA